MYKSKRELELKRTAWAGSCTSWYKTADGKIVDNRSADTVHHWLRTWRPKLAHYLVR